MAEYQKGNAVKNKFEKAIVNAMSEAGVDYNTRRRAYRQVMKCFVDNHGDLLEWLAERGVVKNVGFTKSDRPKTISPVAITRSHVPTFIIETQTN
jgi:1,2-phenylacetyl-CoA epoxidase catalytic subunit